VLVGVEQPLRRQVAAGTEQTVRFAQRHFQRRKGRGRSSSQGIIAATGSAARSGGKAARRRLEGDDVVDVEADADFLADRVIVVRRDQREHFDAAPQPQGVQDLGAAKGLVADFGQQLA
jgi:hypothetical protein